MAFVDFRARRNQFTALLLLVVTAAGCASLLSETQPFGSVRIRVVTRDSQPVAGVPALLYTGERVMAYDTTDAAGRILFRDVPPNNYGVLISIPEGLVGTDPRSRQAYFDQLGVTAGQSLFHQFVLTAPGFGAIEAAVVDSSGRAVEGVNIDVYTSREVVASIVTDSNGTIRLDSVPVGQYGVWMYTPDTLGAPSGPFLYIDTLVVTEFRTPRGTFVIPTCRGEFAVSVLDQFNQPIAGMTVTRYNSLGLLGNRVTGSDGIARFRGALCGGQGARLEPQSGFTINPARGNGYFDGFLGRGDTLQFTLRAQRN